MPVTDEELAETRQRVADLHDEVAEAERAGAQRFKDADNALAQERLLAEEARLRAKLAEVQAENQPVEPAVEVPVVQPEPQPEVPVESAPDAAVPALATEEQ